MKRFKLVVAYDGTNYCGWQTQPNGMTIQGVLNDTLSELLGEKIETIGASRTDAGVHALGNVAVFDTESRIPGEKFSYALNQRLPEDIRIRFRKQSKELMHMVDLLTFNGRTIVMFVVVLVGEVWVYFLYEIIVLNIVLLLAMRKHEQMCATFYK